MAMRGAHTSSLKRAARALRVAYPVGYVAWSSAYRWAAPQAPLGGGGGRAVGRILGLRKERILMR